MRKTLEGIIKYNNTNINNEMIYLHQLVTDIKTISNKFTRYYEDSVKETYYQIKISLILVAIMYL